MSNSHRLAEHPPKYSLTVDDCPVAAAGIIAALRDGDLEDAEAALWIDRLVHHHAALAKQQASPDAQTDLRCLQAWRRAAMESGDWLPDADGMPRYSASKLRAPQCEQAAGAQLSPEEAAEQIRNAFEDAEKEEDAVRTLIEEGWSWDGDQWQRPALAQGTTPDAGVEELQSRVDPWLQACFGPVISADKVERNHRFLEEALELVQACGCTQSEAHQLVDYVFGRPVGERSQEVGGVMITLAALCLAQGLNMHEAGEAELARIWTMVEKIRAKQAAKPKHSPLPQAAGVGEQATGGEAMTPDCLADYCEAWLQAGGASNLVDAYEAGARQAEKHHAEAKLAAPAPYQAEPMSDEHGLESAADYTTRLGLAVSRDWADGWDSCVRAILAEAGIKEKT